MFRLGVVSDSHGSGFYLREAAQALATLPAIAHLGDYQRDADAFGQTVYSVSGNCDMAALGSKELLIELSGTRVYMTHGHRYRVKSGLYELSLRARELNAQVALYGHTHMPSVEFSEGILFVNPGALMAGQYAILEWRAHGVTPVMKIL